MDNSKYPVYNALLQRSESPDTGSSDDHPLYAPKPRKPAMGKKQIKQMLFLFGLVFLLLLLIVAVVVIIIMVQRQDDKALTTPSPVPPNITGSPSKGNTIDLSQALEAQLTYGKVHGKLMENSKDVIVFKGIPYAVPPIGKLRWRAPEPKSTSEEAWPKIYNADEYGSKCVQFDIYRNKTIGSEDCLYLNIWRPATQQQEPRPVMVYIHGGGLNTEIGQLFGHDLLTGSGHEEGMTPDPALVRDSNMVYVTFNYRLGPLGFLSLNLMDVPTDMPDMKGNYGLLDQRELMRWVKDNIHAFGGDPNKVTLFGLGGGATSILAHLAAPSSRGLFHRAWLASPAPLTNNSLHNAHMQNIILARRGTECGTVVIDHEMLDCLMRLSPEKVTLSVPPVAWHNVLWRELPQRDEHMVKLITVDGDFLPYDPITTWHRNNAYDVPIIFGSVAQETDTWLTVPTLKNWTVTDYTSNVSERLLKLLNDNQANLDMLFSLYSYKIDAELHFTSMVSEIRSICPLHILASLADNKNQKPVYRYIAALRNNDFGIGSTHGKDGALDTQILDDPSQGRRKREIPRYQRPPQDSDYHLPPTSSEPVRELVNMVPSSFTPGFSYSYHGLDMRYFLDGARDYTQLGQNYTSILRQAMTEFAHKGSITNWGTFPQNTTLISSHITGLIHRYRDNHCSFWNQNGFFPKYTWSL